MIPKLVVCLGLCVMAGGGGAQQSTSAGSGAILRVLEKINGQVSDHELENGASWVADRITITLRECRYPTENPAGEAYAYLMVQEQAVSDPVFQGWMIASSPALNAMEHPRYDVWVLRCKTD